MKLYHATFSKLAKKIKKIGYLGNSPYKMWSDSNNKYVYLAISDDIAYSYAETCLDDIEDERLYDMLEDDEIVIFEIDTKDLDLSKLKKDENVIDGNTTYQYEGTIPYNVLKIVDYRESINEVLKNAGVQIDESIILDPEENDKWSNSPKGQLIQKQPVQNVGQLIELLKTLSPDAPIVGGDKYREFEYACEVYLVREYNKTYIGFLTKE